MTDNLYDALEICLQALEKGAEIESCLQLFPALADELRPILETASQARTQAIQDVPVDGMRRGRARVLQHAAELREQKRVAVVPFWRKPFQTGRALRVAATSLTTVVFLFSSGTGLVFASSGSLPGDNLYPVKRSWEGVQLALILDPKAKMERENEFEHERVNEIHELFSESRKTRVDFQGLVESQQVNVWQIAGLRIAIDHDAVLNSKITPGALVRVIGETEDGVIQAEQIILIQSPSASQTPTPQKTPTRFPTEEPSDTKTPEKTIEPRETEKPEAEAPEPEKTDSHEQEATKETTKDKGSGKGDGGGCGDGGGDSGGGDSGGGDSGGGG
jgi:uncharacterized membrane protein YgcG